MRHTVCDFCEKPLPQGCHHINGSYAECPLGARADAAWIVGLAVWEDLTDRRGVKSELGACGVQIQAEIIETIGQKAINAMKTIEVAK